MNPSPPKDDAEPDFEAIVRTELDERDDVTAYETTEASANHVLARVSERSSEGDEITVLYKVQRETHPDRSMDTHWEDFGTVGDKR